MVKKSLGLAFALIGMFVFQTAIAAEAKVTAKSIKMMKEAQALVKVGKYADAYALMEPYEFDKSGDITYDYLLGISAVNAGKPDRATLALERVEAVSPQHGDVRLWLGIAYFQSGDSARSKKTFESLLKQPKLSQQTMSTADQYLVAIKQQEDAKALAEKKATQPYLVGMAEFGVGSDSNITTRTLNDYPSAYFTSIGVNYSDTPPSGISAKFGQLNGNLEARVPFNGAGSYGFISFDSANRYFQANANMNPHTQTMKGGLNLVAGRGTYRVDLSKKLYRQLGSTAGYTSDSSQNSINSDARFILGERDYLGISLQYSTPRFADKQLSPEDTNQVVMGANYTHIFAVKGSPMIYLSLNQTRDKAVNEKQTQVYQNNTLVQTVNTNVTRVSNAFIAYSQYSFVESADITAMWMTSRRNDSKPYARSNSFGLEYGKDDMRVTMLGVNWRLAKDWLVKPQIMNIRNISNIPLYEFKKTELSVSVKREFK